MTANELLSILRSTCILQCLVVGLIFVFRGSSAQGGIKYLAAYLLVGAFNFSVPLLSGLDLSLLLTLNNLSAVLFSPLLFLFFTSYLDEKQQSESSKKVLIIAPVALVLLGCLIVYNNELLLRRLSLGVDFFNTALLIYTFILFRRSSKSLNSGSSWIRMKIKWSRFLIVYSLALNFSYYLSLFIIGSDSGYGIYMANIHFSFILIFIIGLIYTAISSPELVSNFQHVKSRLSSLKDLKYKYSELTIDQASTIIKKLDTAMGTDQLYKDPELTLEKLSYTIGNDSKDISQSINQYLRINFKEYLNDWRIKKAKEMLANNETKGLRVSEIMYEVGYSSKSSFNTTFKKKTGLTPKEYRQNTML